MCANVKQLFLFLENKSRPLLSKYTNFWGKQAVWIQILTVYFTNNFTVNKSLSTKQWTLVNTLPYNYSKNVKKSKEEGL